MSFQYIDNHEDAATARLLEFYKGKPRVRALIRAFAARSQLIEDTLQGISTGTLLAGGTTAGAQLDGVGRLVGIARNGQSDAVYQLLILGTIAQNYSTGSLDTIQRVCRTLYQTEDVYISTPNAPGHARNKAYAEVSISIGNAKTDPSLFPLILSILQKSLSAGVKLTWLSVYTGKALACDGPQSWDAGFSDLAGNGGGVLASLSYSG